MNKPYVTFEEVKKSQGTGVKHTIKTSYEGNPVKVFWFHSSSNI